jgi:hypothetical protein
VKGATDFLRDHLRAGPKPRNAVDYAALRIDDHTMKLALGALRVHETLRDGAVWWSLAPLSPEAKEIATPPAARVAAQVLADVFGPCEIVRTVRLP